MRPLFLRRSGFGTHQPATKTANSSSGSRRFDFSKSWPMTAAAWMACNTAVCANAFLCISREEWSAGAWLAIGSAVSGMACVYWAVVQVCKASAADRIQQESGRIVREASARRESLKAQLAAMDKHDPRRGQIGQELKRQTYVVLGGGRA